VVRGVALFAVGCTLLLPGCGGGGGAREQNADGVRALIREFLTDLRDGKSTAACDLMTDNARNSLSTGGPLTASCDGVVALASGDVGKAKFAAWIREVPDVKVVVTGTSATAGPLQGSADQSPAAFVYADGHWKIDGDGRGGPAPPASSAPPPASIGGSSTAPVAKTWPARWCQAQVGMTKEQLYVVMGQPTRGTQASSTWSAFNYEFNAFFDTDGRVRELDTNPVNLTSVELAQIQCPQVRRAP
jgi:hypothetical protein